MRSPNNIFRLQSMNDYHISTVYQNIADMKYCLIHLCFRHLLLDCCCCVCVYVEIVAHYYRQNRRMISIAIMRNDNCENRFQFDLHHRLQLYSIDYRWIYRCICIIWCKKCDMNLIFGKKCNSIVSLIDVLFKSIRTVFDILTFLQNIIDIFDLFRTFVNVIWVEIKFKAPLHCLNIVLRYRLVCLHVLSIIFR